MADSVKEQFTSFIHQLQQSVCLAIEQCDGAATFKTDKWQREGGGGGITRVIANGNVFEKGGVNTSVVYGSVTESMRRQLNIQGDKWFASGISSVLHPVNPFIPTVHFNYRYFEMYNEKEELIDCWFGGGTDLTPYYLFEDDVIHFHKTYKNICDEFDKEFYPVYKSQCDNYFVNSHRNGERRGVGGIFFDYQKPLQGRDEMFWLLFAKACGYGFIDAYLTIADNHKAKPYTAENKRWQEIRRGRYVEFNLVHDRGTLFGLHTNGRTESILMSLPPTVRFEYDDKPGEGSEEERLLTVLQQPKEWV